MPVNQRCEADGCDLLFSPIAGVDEECEPCMRFYREGLTISFMKILTDEAVNSWKYNIHFCILNSCGKFMQLCALHLKRDNHHLLDLLAVVLDPDNKFNTFNMSRQSDQFTICPAPVVAPIASAPAPDRAKVTKESKIKIASHGSNDHSFVRRNRQRTKRRPNCRPVRCRMCHNGARMERSSRQPFKRIRRRQNNLRFHSAWRKALKQTMVMLPLRQQIVRRYEHSIAFNQYSIASFQSILVFAHPLNRNRRQMGASAIGVL